MNTSMEGVFEGKSVENPEAIGCTTSKTTLVLVEPDKKNLFLAGWLFVHINLKLIIIC